MKKAAKIKKNCRSTNIVAFAPRPTSGTKLADGRSAVVLHPAARTPVERACEAVKALELSPATLFAQLAAIAAERRWSSGWVAHAFRELAGKWPDELSAESVYRLPPAPRLGPLGRLARRALSRPSRAE